MKTLKLAKMVALLMASGQLLVSSSCKKDQSPVVASIADSDSESVKYMLEEEKLARDTYKYFSQKWADPQFQNIQSSEQTHMNLMEGLLISSGISYQILPEGKFSDSTLQKLYEQFAKDGASDNLTALQIGATIEDLDIVDLDKYAAKTQNAALLNAFSKLRCGSENHLRAYVSAIKSKGGTYSPQFLSQEEFDRILGGAHTNCGQ